jgi:hypothetical protein
VHPAKVSFPSPNPESKADVSRDRNGRPAAGVEVVTTDFTLTGAGILVNVSQEPLPNRVTLVIDGTAFDCEVRWSQKINSLASRYGLKFHDVLDDVPRDEREAASAPYRRPTVPPDGR